MLLEQSIINFALALNEFNKKRNKVTYKRQSALIKSKADQLSMGLIKSIDSIVLYVFIDLSVPIDFSVDVKIEPDLVPIYEIVISYKYLAFYLSNKVRIYLMYNERSLQYKDLTILNSSIPKELKTLLIDNLDLITFQ